MSKKLIIENAKGEVVHTITRNPKAPASEMTKGIVMYLDILREWKSYTLQDGETWRVTA